MKCEYCSTINEEDAIFCKKCGHPFEEKQSKYLKEEKAKPKTKTKTKKKVKVKTKKKIKKVKEKGNKNQREYRMSFGQKLFMFFLIIFVIVLLGVCSVFGYHYYQEQNIIVPNVVGLNNKEAELKLFQHDLKVKIIEKEVVDSALDGIVIEQNKKEGQKVRKNSKIKITIGVLAKYKLPNFVGKQLDEVKNTLNHQSIQYKIEFRETEEKESNIVLSQFPLSKTKIDRSQIVTLTVSKKVNTKELEEIEKEDIEKKEDSEDSVEECTENSCNE